MSNAGTPAWGVYQIGGAWTGRVYGSKVAAESELIGNDVVRAGRFVLDDSVRPVRVIERSDETQGETYEEARQNCSAYLASQEEAAHASDAEQAGETVETWRPKMDTATGEPIGWEVGTTTFGPAVPDAPGVETRDVFVILNLDGDWQYVREDEDAARELVAGFLNSTYVPATLSYRRPVPAQPSLEQVARNVLCDHLGDDGRPTTNLANEIAAAVRAAFPALGEETK